jgi:hypothetical protein
VNKKLIVSTILLVVSLAGCHPMPFSLASGGQLIDLDARTSLAVSVEGVQARPTASESGRVPRSKEGETIHRVLQNAEGKILFAYDLEVRRGESGTYTFVLKPAGKGPTFDARRELTVAHQDAVRVELMEQPDTGRKVVDVFRLVGRTSEVHEISIGAHLRRAHEMVFQWIHGQ